MAVMKSFLCFAARVRCRGNPGFLAARVDKETKTESRK